MTDPRPEQPFHDLVAAARELDDPMCQQGGGDRWWKAHDALSAALASIPEAFEERVMDELAPTDQTITMSATGGVYPQPVTTGRRRITVTGPWFTERAASDLLGER